MLFDAFAVLLLTNYLSLVQLADKNIDLTAEIVRPQPLPHLPPSVPYGDGNRLLKLSRRAPQVLDKKYF